MSETVYQLPDTVHLTLAANVTQWVTIDPSVGPARGVRVENRTSQAVEYSRLRTFLAGQGEGSVPAGLIMPVDFGGDVWEFAVRSTVAGTVQIEFSKEPFSGIGASVAERLIELDEDVVALSGAISSSVSAMESLSESIQDASSAANAEYAAGTGVRSVTLFGVNPNDEYLIYSIFHSYDREDTGQAARIQVAVPTGPSPLDFYWGPPGGSTKGSVLHNAFYFPPWRILVNGSSITITARTPNVASVIQTLVVMYRYVPF